jgi:uncharacterized membrane protein YvlD (DUF360 family)
MKNGLGVLVVLWYLFCLAIALCSFGFSIYGIYIAFCASVILGIATIFIAPAAVTFGVVQVFFHTNLPQMILDWFSNHH